MFTYETEPSVLAILPAHEELALAPLVLAFAADPAVRWAYPEAHQYRIFFPRFVRAFAGKAFALGTAHYVGDNHGTALWLPPGVMPDDDVLVPLLEETVEADRLDDLLALFEQMGACHPRVPHWYLPLIGVDPCRQGEGLGSVLLGSMLAAFDHTGAVAYLEATNCRNLSLYERHGFEVTGEIQAGSSPTLYAMTRQPR